MAKNVNTDLRLFGKSIRLGVDGGVQEQCYTTSRTAPIVVDDTVAIGTVTTSAGSGVVAIDMSCNGTSFTSTKTYLFPVAFNQTAGAWQIVRPISGLVGAATTSDIQLEISITNSIASLRIRRIVGTNAGSISFNLRVLAGSTNTITPDASTGSAVAAPTGYYSLAALSLFDRVAAAANASSTTTLADPGIGANSTPLTLNSASCQLRLPGSSAHAAFVAGKRTQTGVASITGDLDVRAKVTPTNWFLGQYLVQKDAASPARGWAFSIKLDGTLRFDFSANGTSITTATSTVPVPFAPGQPGWVRVAWVANNGGGSNVSTFYTSTNGTTWTQLGATVAWGGTTGLFNNSATDYAIGNNTASTVPLIGDLHYIDVRSGIAGTTVLPTDPTAWTTASTGTQAAYPALTVPPQGARIKFSLTQDATGSRVVRWPGNVRWPGGGIPTLSTTPGAVDSFEADWDGTQWFIRPIVVESLTATGRVDIQKFTSSGTWTKPWWATQVEFDGFGGGGGGAGGRRGAAGTIRVGGGGGSGANRTRQIFDAADVTATVAVAVGAGGAGGVAAAADSTDGSAGASGGVSTFGTYTKAYGGTGGVGGGTGTGGTGGLPTPGQMLGGNGASASLAGLLGGNASTLNSAAPGGAAGGGITAADVTSAGGLAYSTSDNPNYNSFAGGAAGVSGTTQANRDPVSTPLPGIGGPGGGSGGTAGAGKGANGSLYGAGGGGGGAVVNGQTGGAGGDGAQGIVWVISRG